ncbi:hydroxyisourate hydrolase [Rhizohabitans arisaemae]|uniref:hydroxyisourate hydrolase n=1 Tax=Rhizohabitans arisaemae TaxID=2720610 RepID=UPI0024B0B665|nr:hydroxyisourate hydrolase [Rhizohabitans arisaemae]
MTTTVTTHVLDTALGRPAADLPVRLQRADGTVLAEARTDHDGRASLGAAGPGEHRLVFVTGEWFAAAGRTTFYPQVPVTVTLGEGHHHIPLLLSPYSYSTYRGS